MAGSMDYFWSHRPHFVYFPLYLLAQPHHERTDLFCSRSAGHMKNFSKPLKPSSLHFLHFPGKLRNNPNKDQTIHMDKKHKDL